ERYPELKSNQNFLALQSQLEGTENRIAVARGRYVKSVQEYNVLLRQFPGVITAKLFGYKPKANFSVENEAAISTAPKVDFGNPQPAQ
ncbi:LemA family protein, partial [Acinetobacter baumannii]